VLDQRANMGVSSSPARPRACSTNVVEQCLARFGQCVRTGQNDLRVTLHEKQYIRVQTFYRITNGVLTCWQRGMCFGVLVRINAAASR
jgi:hypothetical protein